jgi:hypothetical protein
VRVLDCISICTQAISAETLHRLAQQTMASRSAQRTAGDIAAVRTKVEAQNAAEEALKEELQQLEASCAPCACRQHRPN